jgi:P2 family phage contractile tail tube protein
MSTAIPEKIINFNMYTDGEKRYGITGEIKLPSLEAITETISGAGIAGEFESATPGHYKSMQVEVPHRIIDQEAFKLANYDLSNLTLRGSMQLYDSGAGKLVTKPLKIVMRGMLKNFDLGSIGVGKPTETTPVLEVLYIKIDAGGENLLEFDKLNFICKINGVDVLADIRNQI